MGDFFLVEWVGENKYSSVPKRNLVDSNLKNQSNEELLGLTTKFAWRRKKYDGIIHQFGSKLDMDFEVTEYAKNVQARNSIARDTADSTNARRVHRSGNTISVEQVDSSDEVNFANANEVAFSNVTNVLHRLESTQGSLNDDDEKENLKREIEKLKKRVDKWKYKATTRKSTIKTLEQRLQNENTMENINISSNVVIPKHKIDTIKALSDRPTVFARNMMRVLFTDAELREASLFGVACSANNNAPARAELDPLRRDAIIKYTLQTYGYQIENIRMRKSGLLRQIKMSMPDYMRELKNKDRRTNNNQNVTDNI